jgi:hypothetical protein
MAAENHAANATALTKMIVFRFRLIAVASGSSRTYAHNPRRCGRTIAFARW